MNHIIASSSSPPDGDLEEAVIDDTAGGERCVSQQLYIDSGNDKKVLFLLCIGLKFDDEPLFAVDDEPWSTLPRTVLRPRNNDFVHDFFRRARHWNMNPLPRPRNWNRQQTMEWLERNPVSTDANVEFLTNEVLRLRDHLLRKAQEEQDQRQAIVGRGGSGHWRGCVPYLRVIMCLTRDDVKCLFLTRANTRSRAELDARNSDTRYVHCHLPCDVCCCSSFSFLLSSTNSIYFSRPQTVFELIAQLWNDSSFNPTAPASDCHSDYQSAVDCSYEVVAGLVPPTAPQKIENVLTSMRSDLLRIIPR